MNKIKYSKSLIALVALVVLFIVGFLVINQLPKDKLVSLGMVSEKLPALSLNLCKKTVTVSATTRSTAPICVERPWWCIGSPMISNVSGTWSNGSPGWVGNPPLYGLATGAIPAHGSRVCDGKQITFDNGGLTMWFWEPNSSDAIYADNKGSHTFNVNFTAPKMASISVNSVEQLGGGKVKVSWTPNPKAAFTSFSVMVGVRVGPQVVRATVSAPAGATSATVNINTTSLPVGQSSGFASVTGNLTGGYYCAIQDGGEYSLSNTVCYGESDFSFKK